MKSVDEFLQDSMTRALPGPQSASTTGVKDISLPVLRESMTANSAEKMARTMAFFVASPDFTQAVDETVPPPRPGESEDEFVARGKKEIAAILLRQLAGDAQRGPIRAKIKDASLRFTVTA